MITPKDTVTALIDGDIQTTLHRLTTQEGESK